MLGTDINCFLFPMLISKANVTAINSERSLLWSTIWTDWSATIATCDITTMKATNYPKVLIAFSATCNL